METRGDWEVWCTGIRAVFFDSLGGFYGTPPALRTPFRKPFCASSGKLPASARGIPWGPGSFGLAAIVLWTRGKWKDAKWNAAGDWKPEGAWTPDPGTHRGHFSHGRPGPPRGGDPPLPPPRIPFSQEDEGVAELLAEVRKHNEELEACLAQVLEGRG